MLYRSVKLILGPDECARVAEIIRKQPQGRDDPQVPGSAAHYGLPVTNTLLGLLCARVSKEAGRELRPTYSYARVYRRGNDLKPHKDRPSCEYSVTLNLSQTHPWPIFMGKKSIVQNVGDGVLYKGCEIEHSRGPFDGDEYIQVFLHYVDAAGPYKDYVHDAQTPVQQQQPLTLMFARSNPNLLNYYLFKNAFSADECQFLTKAKFDVGPGLTEDGTQSDVRKSRIFWIPKTDQWGDLYHKIMELVARANKDFFNFDISSLTENLQYTEYEQEYDGRYDWHFDIGNGTLNCGRKLSVSIQLTDPSEYEGGELQFSLDGDRQVISEKDQGSMVIFPSYLRHRVTPVTHGKRCSLVTWITGPPFR